MQNVGCNNNFSFNQHIVPLTLSQLDDHFFNIKLVTP